MDRSTGRLVCRWTSPNGPSVPWTWTRSGWTSSTTSSSPRHVGVALERPGQSGNRPLDRTAAPPRDRVVGGPVLLEPRVLLLVVEGHRQVDAVAQDSSSDLIQPPPAIVRPTTGASRARAWSRTRAPSTAALGVTRRTRGRTQHPDVGPHEVDRGQDPAVADARPPPHGGWQLLHADDGAPSCPSASAGSRLRDRRVPRAVPEDAGGLDHLEPGAAGPEAVVDVAEGVREQVAADRARSSAGRCDRPGRRCRSSCRPAPARSETGMGRGGESRQTGARPARRTSACPRRPRACPRRCGRARPQRSSSSNASRRQHDVVVEPEVVVGVGAGVLHRRSASPAPRRRRGPPGRRRLRERRGDLLLGAVRLPASTSTTRRSASAVASAKERQAGQGLARPVVGGDQHVDGRHDAPPRACCVTC